MLRTLNITTAIALASAAAYFWGWQYWATYYHHLGLPYDFANNLGTERLILAGAYFLFRFLLVVGFAILGFVFLDRTLAAIDSRCFNGFIRRTVDPLSQFLTSPSSRAGSLVRIAIVLLVLYVLKQTVSNYVVADATIDARQNRPHDSGAFIEVTLSKDVTGFDPTAGRVELLAHRDNNYYLLQFVTATPSVVIVPESIVTGVVLKPPQDQSEE